MTGRGKRSVLVLVFFISGLAASLGAAEDRANHSLPVIQKNRTTGFSNGGWGLDRYPNLEPLNAHTAITVADLKGPGVITHIHTTRHAQPAISTRGVVLLIYFNHEAEPAVQCPLGDFFGDGCNGKSMDFTSNLIECAPGSYNVYIPMPFETAAKVVLRNDSDVKLSNYSYVEWETLERWDPSLGYFHATYDRRVFQLTNESIETFFHTRGAGHILGRQFSIVTDEPVFRGYAMIVEGNNEVDIDGNVRHLDYLGSEDSFTFSWGIQRTFAGQRAGMTVVAPGDINFLSIYRFHDYMPIRFNREITWTINWEYEYRDHPDLATFKQRKSEGGGWVDYATVFYWYQDHPAGYKHAPLPAAAERIQDLLRSSRGEAPKKDQP